jgi:predicted P-loop ATPase
MATRKDGLRRGLQQAPAVVRSIQEHSRVYIRNGEGKPRPLLANVVTALRTFPEWHGVLAYNEFSHEIVTRAQCPSDETKPIDSTWTDADDVKLTDWMHRHYIFAGRSVVADAVLAVASVNRFHPIRDYFGSLTWDNTPRIDCWLVDYLGIADTPYTRAIGARWLISVVARIFRPGCQADHSLMLEGPQGQLKSTALRTIAGDEHFTDNLSDLQSKDSKLELRGKLIIECSDMHRLRRAEAEQVKSFLTRRADHYRPPYGRYAQDFPRQCIFALTTNENAPLSDPTGNRRFWPVKCGHIDIDALVCDRDQLWAEAVAKYNAGAKWWLDTSELVGAATAEQAARYEHGVWDSAIMDWLEKPTQSYNGSAFGEKFRSTPDRVTIPDILTHCIGNSIDKYTQQDQNTVARCLTNLGWRRRYSGARDDRFYCYDKPPTKNT